MTILQSIYERGKTRWKALPLLHRRRILVGGMFLVGVDCLLLILTSEPVLVWFAYRFRAEDPLTRSDAIVMLLGGHIDRPARAAEIYREGLAPIILMGLTQQGSGQTESHHHALIQNGVPADAIVILPGATVGSTHDEALRVYDYVRTHPIRGIIIVTSAYHSARARWTFQKVLRGLGIDVRMTVSRNSRFAETDWYEWNDGIKLYLSEALKTLYYRLVY